jgi:hypothetical protein
VSAAMTTKPKLTAEQKKERNAAALQFATAIAGGQIMFEVLDRTDGVFTNQVIRVAFEMAEKFVARSAA